MIVLVIGRRGLGKTTLAEWRARSFSRNVVAFDPRRQFRNYRVQTSDLRKAVKELDRDWTDDEPLSLSYCPPKVITEDGEIRSGEFERQWNKFANELWGSVGEAEFVLIVDEAHSLQSPNYLNEWLSVFVRETPTRERGDVHPVDIIMTSHRLQDFHGAVTSQVNEIYLFNMVKPIDLKKIEDEWGAELAARVRALRTPRSDPAGRDVLFIDPETGESRLLEDPREWYIDLRKPDEEVTIPSKRFKIS